MRNGTETYGKLEIADRFFHTNGSADPFFDKAFRGGSKTSGIEFVELLFTDLNGVLQHMRMPLRKFAGRRGDLSSFNDGIVYDGSSIAGSQEIHVSDMLLLPDPTTAVVNPFELDTISVMGNIRDARTGQLYGKDPRNIAMLAAEYLKSTKIADTMFVGPELEFFLVDRVNYSIGHNHSSYELQTPEGSWNSGDKNMGKIPVIPPKKGYFPEPSDSGDAVRKEMVRYLQSVGIDVERDHHEVAAGQSEINMKYSELVDMADKVQLYKTIIRKVARRHGMQATFMPKPMEGDNGSGMHVHQSLSKKGGNIFHDPDGYANLSELAQHYIAGILAHAPALCAIIAPTTNSYRRLVPGFEAPVNLVYGEGNRSAAVRIPTNRSKNKYATRIEFRTPDPTANPYLAFAGMLLAGLDGIQKKMKLDKPFEEDVYTYHGTRKVRQVPGTLDEAVDALESDHGFLVKPGVFPEEVIDELIRMRKEEAARVKLSVHPREIEMFFHR